MIAITPELTENERFIAITISGEVWKIIDKKLYRSHLADIRRCTSRKDLSDFFLRVEKQVAKGYIYKLLAIKGYMKSELRRKLEARKVTSRVIEETLEECEKQGFVNDQKEAEFYVQRSLQKGWGPALVHQKLSKKLEGMDSNAFVRKHISDQDQRDAVTHWIEKKYAKLDLCDLKIKQKIYRFLRGKGFDDSLIREFLFAD